MRRHPRPGIDKGEEGYLEGAKGWIEEPRSEKNHPVLDVRRFARVRAGCHGCIPCQLGSTCVDRSPMRRAGT